jgi:hypothetical protein
MLGLGFSQCSSARGRTSCSCEHITRLCYVNPSPDLIRSSSATQWLWVADEARSVGTGINPTPHRLRLRHRHRHRLLRRRSHTYSRFNSVANLFSCLRVVYFDHLYDVL